MNYFESLYTLIEIAVDNGVEDERLFQLSSLLRHKNVTSIKQNFPEIIEFIPYCKWYVIKGKNMLAMSAYIYDVYRNTGLLPSLNNFDYEPDTDKLEHWQYINPIVYEINPNSNFEFAKDLFKDCDVWNLFLSGCARMNYYEGKNTGLEQRIKFAIVEYMIRRPQFFTTEDFVENEVLHKKYNKSEE